jgi:hypothetical protein
MARTSSAWEGAYGPSDGSFDPFREQREPHPPLVDVMESRMDGRDSRMDIGVEEEEEGNVALGVWSHRECSLSRCFKVFAGNPLTTPPPSCPY